jgi:glutamine synthetase
VAGQRGSHCYTKRVEIFATLSASFATSGTRATVRSQKARNFDSLFLLDATSSRKSCQLSVAPNAVTYSGNNRTHMIRIPESGRFELRLADGAANPYLLQAGILAAGLDGIANRRDPGKRLDINMYTHGHTVGGAKTLPLNLLDALRALDASEVLKPALGAFLPAYIKLKTEEWNAYARHLTQWERDTTLNC